MKAILITGMLMGLVVLPGCGERDGPRFEGRIVSHVDTYGSGTGAESSLRREGSMTSGFNYGDPSRGPDWRSDIKWHFLRQELVSDVYRVEWTFRPKSGTGGTKAMDVSFDGLASVTVFSNKWQIITFEPGETKAVFKQ
jgi:hypothetical protein